MEAASFDAPDMEVMLSGGTRKRLSSFWQEKPVALVFPRHFG